MRSETQPSMFLLFAGDDYYPSGGARDCVAIREHSDEPAAVEWAERFDTDESVSWWDYPDWKHLARVDDSGLTIVRRWTRDHELVSVSGGHQRKMGPWEVDDDDD